MSRTSVHSEEGFRRYFAMIPNLVFDDERLTLHDRALYGYYVRVCGQGGRCYKSRETIATATGMSRWTVTKARNHLEELGYITVRESDRSPVVVQIVDIWDENARAYLKEEGGDESTPGGEMGSPKKNPPKKNPPDPDQEEVSFPPFGRPEESGSGGRSRTNPRPRPTLDLDL